MTEDYGIPVVHLLKGVLYNRQEEAWRLLIQFQPKIREYVAAIGLELYVDEAEGYAFLKQKDKDEDNEESAGFPQLMQRRPLSYSLTLLCVMLRKKILEFELSGNESRLVVSQDEIIEMVRIFKNDSGTHERKQVDDIKRDIKKVVEFGFLVPLKNEAEKYEINRIIKAFISIDKLNEISDKLRSWQDQLTDNQEEHQHNEYDNQ